MKITISGLPGSGTSTIAGMLADHMGLNLVSAGETFRRLAAEYNMSLEEFGVLAERDPEIDMRLDMEQKRMALEHEGILLEGRLAGHFTEDADLRVWLDAPLRVRAARISKREGKRVAHTIDETIKREECESNRYKEYYQIDLNDHTIYDLIIDTSKHTPEEITAIILREIEERIRREE
ncbi:cytidylate kinase [Methanosarcinales archaeon ex4572_44]|nr:MAG: cytidylate kinase [Methanosarcinales archaeon ex4572_44]